MVRRQPYSLVYSPAARRQLRTVKRQHYSLIRGTLLSFEPDAATRNRKPLRQPAAFEARWELRFGPDNQFRVFYEVDRENRKVNILAFGIKERGRLVVDGEEIKL